MGHCCVQHQLSFIKIPPFVFYTTKSVHFDLILGVFLGGEWPDCPRPLGSASDVLHAHLWAIAGKHQYFINGIVIYSEVRPAGTYLQEYVMLGRRQSFHVAHNCDGEREEAPGLRACAGNGPAWPWRARDRVGKWQTQRAVGAAVDVTEGGGGGGAAKGLRRFVNTPRKINEPPGAPGI